MFKIPFCSKSILPSQSFNLKYLDPTFTQLLFVFVLDRLKTMNIQNCSTKPQSVLILLNNWRIWLLLQCRRTRRPLNVLRNLSTLCWAKLTSAIELTTWAGSWSVNKSVITRQCWHNFASRWMAGDVHKNSHSRRNLWENILRRFQRRFLALTSRWPAHRSYLTGQSLPSIT